MTKAAILALLLALPALAGCFGATQIPLEPLAAELPAYTGWTWAAPLAHDGTGALLPEPPALAREPMLPVGVEQLVPGYGAEPNLGVTSAGNIFVTTLETVERSSDHGRTWQTVWELRSPLYPTLEDQFQDSDPMLWVDPATDRVFNSPMHPGLLCTYMAFTDREGERGSWTEHPMNCGVPYIDHQKLMTAPPGPNAPAGLAPVGYPNLVYLCVNKMELGTWCSVSYDGGLTYLYDRQAYVNDQLCGNINGHPAAWPDGTVGFVLGNLGAKCDRAMTVMISEDNGLTWQMRQCDAELDQLEIDADITVTPDGTAYLLFRDKDNLVHLARSTDKFATCDVFPIAPPGHTLHEFTTITSGDDGRIAMAYLGTRDPQEPGATPSNASLGTRWHLFVTLSHDAASDNPTFVTMQVTPEEDPVQVGCIWLGGGAGGPHRCRNLLDFIDMVHDKDGRWMVAITDGCTPRNGCAGIADEPDFQSRDRQIAVAVQDRGASLFADKGILAPLGLSHPDPIPS